MKNISNKLVRPAPRLFGCGAVTALALLLLLSIPRLATAAEPIRLDPHNSHYFLFHGKPTVLITSGEHYGAVINRAFNYVAYLNELKAHGFNLTRTFAGTFRSVLGAFGIAGDTLAPKAGQFVCPWARSNIPGAGDGGNKFNLELLVTVHGGSKNYRRVHDTDD